MRKNLTVLLSTNSPTSYILIKTETISAATTFLMFTMPRYQKLYLKQEEKKTILTRTNVRE